MPTVMRPTAPAPGYPLELFGAGRGVRHWLSADLGDQFTIHGS
jgi:hypothetical protein